MDEWAVEVPASAAVAGMRATNYVGRRTRDCECLKQIVQPVLSDCIPRCQAIPNPAPARGLALKPQAEPDREQPLPAPYSERKAVVPTGPQPVLVQ